MDFFHTLLSIIFPPTREEALIAPLSYKDMRALRNVGALSDGAALFRYEDEIIRAIVWELKYKKNPHAIKLIAASLREYINERYVEPPLLIPIPLSKKRLGERGYNQVEEILKEICQDPLFSYEANALIRIRETTPQTQLSRKERLTNLSGAFDVRREKKELLTGKHIILVDDVATTGATLTEARLSVMRAGAARVDTLAFAH